MTTAEDVFYLYERNLLYYTDCRKNGKRKCEVLENDNDCYCHLESIVQPFTIGNQYVPCNIKRKCYIKQGEICPVCIDPIMTKSKAFLTLCGHSFHKSCIFKAFEQKSKDKYASNFYCPICRTNLGMDVYDISVRYNVKAGNLDTIENFMITKEYMMPHICSKGWDHYLGINNTCKTCKKYRKIKI
jgi:hypothetical protein